jgi:hypothetical protein
MSYAALAPFRWLAGSGPAGFRHPAAQHPTALRSPISTVTESVRPKLFFVPWLFFVYMLLTLDKIYTILVTSARETDMAHHEIQIAIIEAQIAEAIAADDWRMFDFLTGLMAPYLAKRVVR